MLLLVVVVVSYRVLWHGLEAEYREDVGRDGGEERKK